VNPVPVAAPDAQSSSRIPVRERRAFSRLFYVRRRRVALRAFSRPAACDSAVYQRSRMVRRCRVARAITAPTDPRRHSSPFKLMASSAVPDRRELFSLFAV